jgi:hypothetical protein
MYYRYTKERVGAGTTRYKLQEERIHLFGCNDGFIPWLLTLKLGPKDKEPYKWHVDVVSELASHPKYLDSTLLIDLKPKKEGTNISLYEVLDVWGYSSNGWSPIMLRLNGLFVDEKRSRINRESFVRADDQVSGPIYEFLYVAGTVFGGKLEGKWIPPPASPTNAALLWPEVINYFFQCIKSTTPEVLSNFVP